MSRCILEQLQALQSVDLAREFPLLDAKHLVFRIAGFDSRFHAADKELDSYRSYISRGVADNSHVSYLPLFAKVKSDGSCSFVSTDQIRDLLKAEHQRASVDLEIRRRAEEAEKFGKDHQDDLMNLFKRVNDEEAPQRQAEDAAVNI